MQKLFTKGLLLKKDNGGYSVLASTASVDRQGDSIDQSGWDLANFAKNPVMLWAHDYTQLPIAKANNISVQPEGLVADYEFAPAEGNPMAQQVKTLVDGGFLNAVSVGFMPLERNGNVITKMELFEISFVPVPANPQALQLMLSKGIASDVVSKFFEVKEADIAAAQAEIEKGAVADELAADEAAEAKWSKLNEVWEVMGAFCDVYLDEDTPVESFSSLLTEAISLLTAVVGTDGADDDETAKALKAAIKIAVTPEAAKSLILKMGAAHSKNTKAEIQKAIAHSENAVGVLKNLLAKDEDAPGADDDAEDSSDDDTDDTSDADKGITSNVAEVGLDEVRALLITRNLLRVKESAPRSALGTINALLKEREIVKV